MPALHAISVRDLAAFHARSGSLGSSSRSLIHALDGTRAHQRIQRARPEGYQKEVSFSRDHCAHGVTVRLTGRADGIAPGNPPALEEIKSCRTGPGEPHPDVAVHWMQARLYAALLCERDGLPRVIVRLVYAHLNEDTVTHLEELREATELADLLRDALNALARWLARVDDFREQRNATLESAPFPFPQPRPGQQALMDAVRDACEPGGCLLAEAPTGIGKTAAVLDPALRALARGKVAQVWFLTARSSGKQAARNAGDRFAAAGSRFKRLEITAKSRVCNRAGTPCDPSICPFAIGYYERVRAAVDALFAEDDWSPARLACAAEEHRVCPHELSLDLIAWADLVVCDYNHVFDPRARIRRVFAMEGPLPLAVLIDEAHNLPDRARDMFSAGLSSEDVDGVLDALGPRSGPPGKALRALRKQFADLKAEAAEVNRRDFALEQVPSAFPETWVQTARSLDRWLETAPPSPARPAVLDLFFKLQTLCDTADAFDDRHAMLVSLRGRGGSFRVYCADPSRRLAGTFNQLHATVLFSGTLSPLELFRDMCGCPRGAATLRLPSPFPPEHLDVRTATGVAVTYNERDRSANAVSTLIRRFLQEQRGATLVFFPSYAYLDLIAKAFEFETGFGVIALQRPGMDEAERAALAGRLGRPGGPTALFAVLGGSLGEAVEWPEALISGAVIVGVGLPQVGLERDLIRALHDREGRDGFAIAYRVPGMTRVIQAAGRVIRNETDRGAVLLIDRRFALAEYRELFPPHWQVRDA